MELAPARRMISRRVGVLVALVPLLASCGGAAADVVDPGIDGTLVMERADLHAVLGATSTGDIVVVTNDGTVLALDATPGGSFASRTVATWSGRLGDDLEIEIAGGAVLFWRDRGHDTWDLDAWSRAGGLRSVATGLARRASLGVTSATPDGQRIVFATGGVFTDGVGSDLLFYGVTLPAPATLPSAAIQPVQLARIPAGNGGVVEIALVGQRAVLKRYTELALEPGAASKRGWPESEEPWEAQWFDEAWRPLRSIGHREDIAVGDTALRLATNGADGELAVETLDGSAAIPVDHGCRSAEAFFLPGDEDLVYSCRGAAHRFTVATGERTTLGSGMAGAYPLECGDGRCHDWVGGPGPSVVAVQSGASLPGPEISTTQSAHGNVYGRLSPDGHFARVPGDGGAIAIVTVGHLDQRIVLEREARGFIWLDGARFVFAITSETDARYADALSAVYSRDPGASGSGTNRVVTRDVYSPFARAGELALYAITKTPSARRARPGLYRFSLSDPRAPASAAP